MVALMHLCYGGGPSALPHCCREDALKMKGCHFRRKMIYSEGLNMTLMSSSSFSQSTQSIRSFIEK
jgi:hypothetical protein